MRDIIRNNKSEIGYIPEPIEPKSGFPNPYRAILKHIVKTEDEKPVRATLELTALFCAPGGALYFKKNVNDIKRENCLQKGKKLVEVEFDKGFKGVIYMIEITKFPLAYLGSSLVSKLIF